MNIAHNGYYFTMIIISKLLLDWVKNQRFQYRALKGGGNSRLNEERILMMEEIGFVFDVPGT